MNEIELLLLVEAVTTGKSISQVAGEAMFGLMKRDLAKIIEPGRVVPSSTGQAFAETTLVEFGASLSGHGDTS